MIPSEDLFNLIHSLTKAEKRHLKLVAQRHVVNGMNNYVKLFDAICTQKRYDENELKKRFSKEKWVKHFAFQKNHLSRLILNGLHIYHLDLTEETRLKKELHQAALLHERGLQKQSEKLLKKVKARALKLELYVIAFEANGWLRKILAARSYSANEKNLLIDLIESNEDIILRMENQDAYESLQHRMVHVLFRQSGIGTKKQKEELERIIKDPLLKSETKALTATGRNMFNTIRAIYYSYGSPDLERALEHDKRRVHLTEQHPEIISREPGAYIVALRNLILSSIRLGKYDEALEVIAKMKKFPNLFRIKLARQQEATIFVLATIQELAIYINKGKFEQVNSLVQGVNEGMKRYGNIISPNNEMELYYTIAYMFWANAESKKALSWLNRIVLKTNEKVRTDLVFYANLLNYFAHVDMKDHDFLSYQLRSIDKLLKSGYVPDESEQFVLDFMRHFESAVEEKERKKFMNELKSQLMAMKRPMVENKLNVLCWLESKISKRPLPDILREERKNEASR